MSHRPDFRRWMLFVDGENLAIRARGVANSGAITLREGPFYEPDEVVWLPSHRATQCHNLYVVPYNLDWSATRAYYYTSVSGDDPAIAAVREALWALGFAPAVFKKIRKDTKAKGVDIALTKDMLSHAFQQHYQTAVLIAGDADYIPLIEEVKRLGCRVCLAFFRQHTPDPLRIAADDFVDLTRAFADSWNQYCHP